MAHYSNPPPPYPGTTGKAVPPTYDDAATQPLLGAVAGRSGVYDHSTGEFPDDFLVSFNRRSFFRGSRGTLVWTYCRRMRATDSQRFRAQGLHHLV